MPNVNLAELLLRQKIFAVIVFAVIFLVTLEFIRRHALKERYALLWLAASAVIIPLVLWFGALERISALVGIAYPPATVLLAAVLFIIMILFHFSVAMSKSRRREEALLLRAVELAERIENLERRLGAGQGRAD